MAYDQAVLLTSKTMMLGIGVQGREFALHDNVDNHISLEFQACVLLRQQHNIVHFGNEALQRMEDWPTDKFQETGFRMFRPFEILEKVKHKKELFLQDEQGNVIEAQELLKLLFEAVLRRFQSVRCVRSQPLSHTDVSHAVIIVPQSWSSAVKQCIFESATQAQMTNVMILNDTEAVATMCQIELQDALKKDELNETKHLIINWGDVFTEMTSMQLKFDKTMRIEFYGKIKTDGQSMLFNRLNAALCNGCESSFPEEKEELMKAFIEKLYHLNNEETMIMQIPTSLQSIKVHKTQGFSLGGGKIRVASSIFPPFFDSLASDTLSTIANLFGKKWKDEIGGVLVYGDLSRMPLAIKALKKILQVPVHQPSDPSVAVLRGALCFGRRPEIGTSRIIRSIVEEVDGSDFLEGAMVARDYNVVASFDFGTTYSGYAFAIQDEPDKIHVHDVWHQGGNLWTTKTPTAVLLNPAKEFDSFGFLAEHKYASLIDEGEHKSWMLFRRFKMMLHDTGESRLQRHTLLEDIDGNKMPAMDIFSMSIQYLRDHMLETVCNAKSGITENTVLYVITVPAIWSDAAKQFMKEAAIKAGIDDDRVLLALEPEAAAIWCQHIDTDIRGTAVGTQFMVADIGGGTTDISVQEKTSDGRLAEIFRPEGGAWGGTNVDKAFVFWMEKVFGEQSVTTFLRMRSMDDYFDLLNNIEYIKRDIMSSKTSFKVNIRVPAELRQICKDRKIDVDYQLNKLKITDRVTLKTDKLQIEGSIAVQWFSDTIENISAKMIELLQKRELLQVKRIILVGGFAESKLLQNALKDRIRNAQIIIPLEARVAVLKGAVKYGQRTGVIACRVVKYSYGIKKTVGFKTGLHDVSQRKSEGGVKVVHLFEQFVEADTRVKIGERISKGFKPVEMGCTTIEIFSSYAKDPKYISENGCEKLGQIEVSHTAGKGLSDKMFDISFEFGRTEIIVMAKMRRSGQEFRAKLDCI